jgi:hypothetical protein
VPSTK